MFTKSTPRRTWWIEWMVWWCKGPWRILNFIRLLYHEPLLSIKRQRFTSPFLLDTKPLWYWKGMKSVYAWQGFLPEASMATGYCRCLRLSVRPWWSLACPRDYSRPIKLGSPNLNHRCKRPWWRSQSFLGRLTLNFKVQFTLKVKIVPILSLFAR